MSVHSLSSPKEPKAETRERIVAAAERVLRERGYARATTKEIARAAGLSEGTLYNYFESKEDLWLDVLSAQQLPGFIALVRSFPERAGTATVRANLEEMARVALAFYLKSVPMGAAVQAEPALLNRLRVAVAARHAGPQRANENVAAYLRAEQDLGRLNRSVNPGAASYLLLGACFQKAHWLQFLNEETQEGFEIQFAREIVDVLFEGIDATGVDASVTDS